MSKPRICKSCKWLRHRVEPCCSCSRWGKGKTDYYIPAEETLKEYLERKEQEDMEKEKNIGNLSTDELIKSLRICGDDKTTCDGCAQWNQQDDYGCANRYYQDGCSNALKNAAADRLEQLQQELIDEREDTSSTADAVPLPLKGKANGNDDTVRRCAEYVAEKHLQMDEEPPEKHKPEVICISGKAQHGKDTTAQFIKEHLEEHGKSVLIMHYSDLLKFIVRTYFGWNGEKDKDGRDLLQYVGTDVIRRQSPGYWTDFAVGLIRMFPDKWDYVILADCRFPNEVECFKKSEFDTCHVRVIRAPFASPLTPEQQLHISETALDAIGADRYLLNTGTLEEYRKTVCTWLTYRAALNREG